MNKKISGDQIMAERKSAASIRRRTRKHRHAPLPHLQVEDAAETLLVVPEGATFIENASRRWAAPDDFAASPAVRAEAGVENIQPDTDAMLSRVPASDSGVVNDS